MILQHDSIQRILKTKIQSAFTVERSSLAINKKADRLVLIARKLNESMLKILFDLKMIFDIKILNDNSHGWT